LASFAVLAAGALATTALGGAAEPAAAADLGSIFATGVGRAGPDRASRDLARPVPPVSPAPSASAALAPAQAAAAPAAPQSLAKRRPVAGLSQLEMDNAVAIIEAGRKMNVPKRAHVVAIVTALQESHLRNLANSRVSQSLNVPHQGVESNFDSVGLFQQRPSQGWGTAAELMDPATAASRFYARLLKVPGWPTMSVGAAAQAVQRSAFPSAYDKHQPQAQTIVDAIF
jgi:hypothetical protein